MKGISWIRICTFAWFCFYPMYLWIYFSIKCLFSSEILLTIRYSKIRVASSQQEKYSTSLPHNITGNTHCRVTVFGQLCNITMGRWHCHWYQTIMWPTAWIFYTRSRKPGSFTEGYYGVDNPFLFFCDLWFVFFAFVIWDWAIHYNLLLGMS